jgi:hypothetical protein
MPYYGAQSNPYFQPFLTDIATISNSNPMTVTTTFTNNYLTGLIVRLSVPPAFGMIQADGLQGDIIVTGTTTFTLNVDSTHFDTFITPSEPPLQPKLTPAQVTPVGEIAAILTQSFINTLTPQF